MALRRVHHAAICRSLLSLACKGFASFSTCHPRSHPLAPGLRTKVSPEAPLGGWPYQEVA